MIEDKSIGLKVATEPLEILWSKVAEDATTLIQKAEDLIIIQKAMKEMAEQKLKDVSKA